MLSKSDKKWLVEEIEKAVVKALTVEIQWEKARDEETGMPLAHKEYKVEDVFLPAFWGQHLKFHEGAYRGMQETVDKLTNAHADGLAKLQALGEFLIGMEPTLKALVNESNTEPGHDRKVLDSPRD